MNSFTALARLVRFPNLVIVALTQNLLQYTILLPNLSRVGLSPMLEKSQFFLLVLSTVLIAAGGYVINDIEDVEIDRLNKPLRKQIVGRILPLSKAWQLYWGLSTLGFITSVYLAFFINDFLQLLIYPIAVGLLWWYSKSLKRLPLWGNLVVSFFCAFVAWVVFYAQSLSTLSHPVLFDHQERSVGEAPNAPVFVFIGYAIFAFLSTLFREIIKDIEDAEGDLAGNCRTLPIVLGIPMSKKIAFGVGCLFLLLTLFFCYALIGEDYWRSAVLLLTVSLPIVYVLYLLTCAQDKKDYSRLSLLAKLIMLSGVIFILLMYNI
jgi:4-hydroxybenzoate polyprenyltransferase